MPNAGKPLAGLPGSIDQRDDQQQAKAGTQSPRIEFGQGRAGRAELQIGDEAAGPFALAPPKRLSERISAARRQFVIDAIKAVRRQGAILLQP